MADLNFSLYDANKSLENNEKAFSNMEILDAIHTTILPFFESTSHQYYMMLCREQYDFTLFNFSQGKDNHFLTIVQHDLYECFVNRGQVLDIELTEEGDAVEIWLRIDEEAYVYYLFPYDNGVIEVGIT